MSKDHHRAGTKGTRPLLSGPVVAVILAAGLLGVCAYMWWGGGRGGQPGKPAQTEESASALVEEAAEMLGGKTPSASGPDKVNALCRRMQAYVNRHAQDTLVIPWLAELYFRTGQLAAADVAVTEGLKRTGVRGQMPARLLCLRGMLVRQVGAKTRQPALFYFQQAVDSPGADAEVWGEFATEALGAGDEKQKALAEKYLDRVLAEGRLRPEQWAGFGLRLTRLKHAKADVFLDRALAGGLARQPVVMANFGLAMLQLGQEGRGRQFLSEVVKTGPKSPELLRAWGEAELRVNNRDRGRELIVESLGMRGDQRECYELLARSTGGPEAKAQAEQHLTDGIAACAKPEDKGWLWLRLGELREQQGRFRDAAEAYVEAAKAPAERFAAAKGATRCYLSTAVYDKAVEWFREARRLNPNDAEVQQLQSVVAPHMTAPK